MKDTFGNIVDNILVSPVSKKLTKIYSALKAMRVPRPRKSAYGFSLKDDLFAYNERAKFTDAWLDLPPPYTENTGSTPEQHNVRKSNDAEPEVAQDFLLKLREMDYAVHSQIRPDAFLGDKLINARAGHSVSNQDMVDAIAPYWASPFRSVHNAGDQLEAAYFRCNDAGKDWFFDLVHKKELRLS